MTAPDDPSAAASTRASGIEALIERLRQDGVEAGRLEAERIVADAEKRANWILDQAAREAEDLRDAARREAERFRSAADEALKVAARDAVLRMKDQLTRQFSEDIGRLVKGEMARPDLLQKLMLEVVGRVRSQAGLEGSETLEVLLPATARDLADLRRNPDELRQGPLSALVISVAADMLRKGVNLVPSPEVTDGIRIRLGESGVEIDLGGDAVAAHLLAHLLPRFRALLEGMVY
jgi:V/A-type H+-transporting ATPase subunit E